MAMHEILEQRPDAIFTQSESTNTFTPNHQIARTTRRFNEKRFTRSVPCRFPSLNNTDLLMLDRSILRIAN